MNNSKYYIFDDLARDAGLHTYEELSFGVRQGLFFNEFEVHDYILDNFSKYIRLLREAGIHKGDYEYYYYFFIYETIMYTLRFKDPNNENDNKLLLKLINLMRIHNLSLDMSMVSDDNIKGILFLISNGVSFILKKSNINKVTSSYLPDHIRKLSLSEKKEKKIYMDMIKKAIKKYNNTQWDRRKFVITAYNKIGLHGKRISGPNWEMENNEPTGAGAANYIKRVAKNKTRKAKKNNNNNNNNINNNDSNINNNDSNSNSNGYGRGVRERKNNN